MNESRNMRVVKDEKEMSKCMKDEWEKHEMNDWELRINKSEWEMRELRWDLRLKWMSKG